MGKIMRNYIYNATYQILALIIPLFLAPYLSRTLGPEMNGIYAYVYSASYIIYTLLQFGIYNYANRQIAYHRDNKNKLSETYSQIMGLRFILLIVTSIIYFAFSIINSDYTQYFLIYYPFIIAVFIDCTWLYVGVEDMKWAAIKNSLTKILSFVLIIIFVKTQNDLDIYILIQGGSLLLSNLLAYTQVKKYVDSLKPKFSSLWTNLLGSIRLFLPSLASIIYLQCDKIMIEAMTGSTSQIAFYDYAEKIILIPMTLISVLGTVTMPRIANNFKNGENNKIKKLLINTLSVCIFMSIPMIFGLFLISDKLIPWYLGDSFTEASFAIKILCPIIFSNAIVSITGSQYFTATNQTKILLKSQLPSLMLNLVLNAILIPRIGFYGAAIATLFTSFLCMIIQIVELNKQIKINILYKDIIKYFIFSCAMYIIVSLSTSGLPPAIYTTIIQVISGASIFILLCITTRDKNSTYITKLITKWKRKKK